LLGWSDLGRLAETGIEVGSHSRSHADLPTLRHARLIDEVLGSADTIAAELGRRPAAFAYPYGTLSESVVAAVGTHYAWGCTADLRPVDVADSRELLPRIDMCYFGTPALLEGWGSTWWRRYLAMRRELRAPRQRLRTAVRRRRASRQPATDETVA
jgi:peptidoglycan/xylan/chitin deacetylase (PgdA/CDA1 family)